MKFLDKRCFHALCVNNEITTVLKFLNMIEIIFQNSLRGCTITHCHTHNCRQIKRSANSEKAIIITVISLFCWQHMCQILCSKQIADSRTASLPIGDHTNIFTIVFIIGNINLIVQQKAVCILHPALGII